MIARAPVLSEAADDVLDSITRMHVASCAELAGDTGRTPTEVRRAIRELGMLVNAVHGRYSLARSAAPLVEDCDDTAPDTGEAPAEPTPTASENDCDDAPATVAARVFALVTATSGLSTQQISDRLAIGHKTAARALHSGPYRSERERRQKGGRTVTVARWFVAGPAPSSVGRRAPARGERTTLADRVVALIHAHPGISQREACVLLPGRAGESVSRAVQAAVRMGRLRAEGNTTSRRFYPPEGGRGGPLIPDPSTVGPGGGPMVEPDAARAAEGPVESPAGTSEVGAETSAPTEDQRDVRGYLATLHVVEAPSGKRAALDPGEQQGATCSDAEVQHVTADSSVGDLDDGGSRQEVRPATSAPSLARPPTDPDGSGDPVADTWRERCLAAEARARAAEERCGDLASALDEQAAKTRTANLKLDAIGDVLNAFGAPSSTDPVRRMWWLWGRSTGVAGSAR